MTGSAKHWATLLLILGALPVAAQTKLQESTEDSGLRERFDALELEVAQLRANAASEEGRFPILSSLEAELYGYIKLDAAWDSARSSVGNFARWVESEGQNPEDDQLSLTVKQTRLGLKFMGSRDSELVTSGRVEFDFFASASENKPELMLRHAYLKLAQPSGWEVLAGQASDVISPLYQLTINYTAGWWQGNIGYRRPQLRVTRELECGSSARKLELALARTISGRPVVGPENYAHPTESPFEWVFKRLCRRGVARPTSCAKRNVDPVFSLVRRVFGRDGDSVISVSAKAWLTGGGIAQPHLHQSILEAVFGL